MGVYHLMATMGYENRSALLAYCPEAKRLFRALHDRRCEEQCEFASPASPAEPRGARRAPLQLGASTSGLLPSMVRPELGRARRRSATSSVQQTSTRPISRGS